MVFLDLSNKVINVLWCMVDSLLLKLTWILYCTPIPIVNTNTNNVIFQTLFETDFTRDTPQDFEALVCLGTSFIESQQNAAIIQTFYEIKE